MPEETNKRAIPVAIAAVINNNKILLIKRTRGDYIGLWGLPGGKIEKNEHVSSAAEREIKEETGIIAEFQDHLGFVSEHLVENNQILNHFLLHVCLLNPKTTEITSTGEGILKWFDLNSIEDHKDVIIPSDVLMINKIVKNKERSYYNCVLEKVGDIHYLRMFE